MPSAYHTFKGFYRTFVTPHAMRSIWGGLEASSGGYGQACRLAGLQACRLVSFPGHVCVCGPFLRGRGAFSVSPCPGEQFFFNFLWPVTWLKSFPSHGVVAFDEQRGIRYPKRSILANGKSPPWVCGVSRAALAALSVLSLKEYE